ncbi:unnamed protein product [Caenorhabditis bovis]|uniref:C2H2-type domain-containing protein n=1 Tax=Caenorhabditis bovis TaxID=2654633 RepID=A0A8S1EKQ6_9PELO|nr:unnamed protein product [Caenorhabditis bovis]
MAEYYCPLCSDTIEKSSTHFLKHFKYKKYSCGDDKCDSRFYTENDRNAHCEEKGHKRSFQKVVNPYVDMLIEMLLKDVELINQHDLETVVNFRLASLQTTKRKTPGSPIKKNTEKKISAKKTKIVKKVSTKKKKKVVSARDADSTTPQLSEAATSDPPKKKKRRSKISEPADCIELETVEEPPKSVEEQVSTSFSKETEMLSRIINQWLGESNKESTTVVCQKCKKDVNIGYLIRKDHVGAEHLGADVDVNDYQQILTEAMNECFPEFPNTDFACQLCMTDEKIPENQRRKHIEQRHGLKLPELKCPFEGCHGFYTRECELRTHMKVTHNITIGSFGGQEFKETRRRRNLMIMTLTHECFPISKFTSITRKAKQIAKSVAVSVGAEEGLRIAQERVNNAVKNAFGPDVRLNNTIAARRAPVYNQESSSSSDDENGTPRRKKTTSIGQRSTDDQTISDIDELHDELLDNKFEDDIKVIYQFCNLERTNRLKEMNVSIKGEATDDFEARQTSTSQPSDSSILDEVQAVRDEIRLMRLVIDRRIDHRDVHHVVVRLIDIIRIRASDVLRDRVIIG